MALLNILRRSTVLFDGAMGTMCQQLGLPASKPPEWYNISHPDVVRKIHGKYARAGARVLTTNTLGGNAIRLSHWGAADRMEEINSTAVRLAKEAAGTRRYVAGSVGPTGKLVRPLGDLDFEEAYDSFTEQMRILEGAGADILLIETMSDLQEARAAVLAAKETSRLPIFVTFTFEPTDHTMSGDSPESIAVVMEALGVEGIGVNCVDDIDLLIRVLRRMATATHLPLLAQPNAGRPRLVGETTTFELAPGDLASRGRELVDAGAGLLGGCCGTTPDHIRALGGGVRGTKPGRRPRFRGTRLASRSRVLELAHHPWVIGELINPSGKKDLTEDLKQCQTSAAKKLAMAQVQAGADLLDVNVAAPGLDEPDTMTRVVEALSLSLPTPLSIDSPNPQALEAGLRVFPGKALLNSTTAEQKKLKALMPLAKKYGAVIAGLTMDEDGIPENANGCLTVARDIVNSAAESGVGRENVVVDPLVLTAGARPERIEETLRAVRSIKRRLNVPVMLGISNVSHGLPNRSSLNAAFLSMAVRAGVDLVIVNPLDGRVSDTLHAAALLTRRRRPDLRAQEKLTEVPRSPDQQLRAAIVTGDKDLSHSAVLRLLESKAPQEIVDALILPALEEVGEQYGRREIYLPQLLLASEAAKAAMAPIKREMQKREGPVERRGKLLFATVRGDLHDIGKNIVIAVLENYGYEVIDLGRDVSNEQIIDEATQNEVDVICLSSLMTTTMGEMHRLTEELTRRGLPFKVLVGGAVVTNDYAESIGASYARDAQEALKKISRILG